MTLPFASRQRILPSDARTAAWKDARADHLRSGNRPQPQIEKQGTVMLTEAQVAHFRTFGFLIFRQLFSPDEVRTIRAEVRQGMVSAYRHAPFDGTRRHWLPMMGPETPFMARLLEDDRF